MRKTGWILALAVCGVYGGAHVWAGNKVRMLFEIGSGASAALAFFMGGMVLAPFGALVAERRWDIRVARFLAWVGFVWMGFFFLFLSAYFSIFLTSEIAQGLGWMLKSEWFIWTSNQAGQFVSAVALALGIAGYSLWEAGDIRLERITVASPKISPDLGRIRVVQVSDIHFGLLVNGRRFQKIIRQVEALCPDLLVSTGDLVDAQINSCDELVCQLNRVHPSLGKYAVTGNHEYYSGIEAAMRFTESAGFTVLSNTSQQIAEKITLAGVEDPAARYFFPGREGRETEVISSLPDDHFVLLLKHRPTVPRGSLGKVDLQLSGHVHLGQIFPFRVFTRLAYAWQAGWYNLGKNSSLYVSRGTGTWGPPMRFLARPEITVFELVHQGG